MAPPLVGSQVARQLLDRERLAIRAIEEQNPLLPDLDAVTLLGGLAVLRSFFVSNWIRTSADVY